MMKEQPHITSILRIWEFTHLSHCLTHLSHLSTKWLNEAYLRKAHDWLLVAYINADLSTFVKVWGCMRINWSGDTVTTMKIALKILVNKNDHNYGASAAEQILSYLPYKYNKYTEQWIGLKHAFAHTSCICFHTKYKKTYAATNGLN